MFTRTLCAQPPSHVASSRPPRLPPPSSRCLARYTAARISLSLSCLFVVVFLAVCRKALAKLDVHKRRYLDRQARRLRGESLGPEQGSPEDGAASGDEDDEYGDEGFEQEDGDEGGVSRGAGARGAGRGGGGGGGLEKGAANAAKPKAKPTKPNPDRPEWQD